MCECPLCGADEAEIKQDGELVDHVWFRHVDGVVCWCGREFNFGGERFEEHVTDCGGYVVHYLECQLSKGEL